MKRAIAISLLAALLANPAFGLNLEAAAVTKLKAAGVTDTQLNQIEAAIQPKSELNAQEFNQIMKDAGLTKAQMQTIAGYATPAVATAGATGTGLSAGLTIVTAVALSVAFIAAAAAVQNELDNDENTSGTVKK